MRIDNDLTDSQGLTIEDPRCNCRELMQKQIERDIHAPTSKAIHDAAWANTSEVLYA